MVSFSWAIDSLVGWLVADWLVSCGGLVDWLIGWLVSFFQLGYRFVGCLGWLLIGWFRLEGWMIG